MITPSELLHVPLFAALSRPQLSRIAARSADIYVNADEWIVHEGGPAYFWAVLEGEIEAVKTVAGECRQVTTFDPGEYFGEVPLMLSTPAATGLRALKPSRPLGRPPYVLETRIPGIFAAGDVRSNSIKRVASGVGEGSMVISFIHEYLRALAVPVS